MSMGLSKVTSKYLAKSGFEPSTSWPMQLQVTPKWEGIALLGPPAGQQCSKCFTHSQTL